MVFGLVSFAVILSNSFAIFIFTRRQFRRNMTHYLPINLAVTDLVVGAIALPLYISLLHSSLATLTWIYLSIDIIAGVALVASIALISLERLYAIGFPWKHRLLKRKHYAIGIMSTWMYAIVFMFFISICCCTQWHRHHECVRTDLGHGRSIVDNSRIMHHDMYS